jgi:hypothetical protein
MKASDYQTIGEIIMKTLEYCLGSSYNAAAKIAWIKIFSVMLRFVIPAALREDGLLFKGIESGDGQRILGTSLIEDFLRSDGSSPPNFSIEPVLKHDYIRDASADSKLAFSKSMDSSVVVTEVTFRSLAESSIMDAFDKSDEELRSFFT